MLPKIRYHDNNHEQTQESFIGGINRKEWVRPGEIYDTENISSEEYPVLRPRDGRSTVVNAEGRINGLGSAAELYYSVLRDGYSEFYYGGNKVQGLKLSEEEKSFVNLGDYIIIWPDMMYYFAGEVKGSYESGDIDALRLLDEAMLTADITDGDYFEADGEIYMYRSGGEWDSGKGEGDILERLALTRNSKSRWVYMGKRFGNMSEKHHKAGISNDDVFTLSSSSQENGLLLAVRMRDITDIKEGDSVKITCLNEEDKSKYTAYVKVREIYYSKSTDVESDIFVLGYDEKLKDAIDKVTAFTMEREVPALDGIFECNMRLWGYKGDSIYASGLGNPFIWSSYTNNTEAWSIDTETAGDITAGCNFDGAPVFFKEDYIFKIAGGEPSDFNLSITPVPGQGCIDAESVIVGGGRVLYLAPEGFAAYGGFFPSIISEKLKDEFISAVGGFDGRRYWTTAKSAGGTNVYFYDVIKEIWYREDDTDFRHYAYWDNVLYASCGDKIKAIGNHGLDADDEIVNSYVEFAPFTEIYLNKKTLKSISVRLKVSEDSEVSVLKKERNGWERKKTIKGPYVGTVFLRVAPKRGDSYSLRIEGKGSYTVNAVSREYALRSKV